MRNIWVKLRVWEPAVSLVSFCGPERLMPYLSMTKPPAMIQAMMNRMMQMLMNMMPESYLLEWASVGGAAIVPAFAPAYFAASGWGIVDTAVEGAFGRCREFAGGGLSCGNIAHATEHLQ